MVLFAETATEIRTSRFIVSGSRSSVVMHAVKYIAVIHTHS